MWNPESNLAMQDLAQDPVESSGNQHKFSLRVLSRQITGFVRSGFRPSARQYSADAGEEGESSGSNDVRSPLSVYLGIMKKIGAYRDSGGDNSNVILRAIHLVRL